MRDTLRQMGFGTGLGAWLFGLACVVAVSTSGLSDEPPIFQKLGDAFTREIRPILVQHCMKCHATDVQEGTLDLEQFATLADVRRSTTKWLKVAEMLDNGEMPPKKAPQPSPERRQRLRAWLGEYLKAEAFASAGDPGPVVLRRLGNAEYTYTLLDLIGVDLQPAREFPVDGAAGEGFTNTGNALVMSPALLAKYLDAGKKIADHAVLLPDGIRFSPRATRRDWTEEILGRIRSFYGRFTDSGGDDVQPTVFTVDEGRVRIIAFAVAKGGRLPLERYLDATVRDRAALTSGTKSVAAVASERGLNAKYLGIVWSSLNGDERSPVLDVVRSHWRETSSDQTAALAAEIARWQNALWRFTSVGQIGRVGGPKAWMEPVDPVVARQELREKIPASANGEVTLSLVAGDAGDGNEHDFVVWDKPRLVAPGRPDLLLRDVRDVARQLAGVRQRAFQHAANCLGAAAEAQLAAGPVDVTPLAERHHVEPAILAAWLDYLGIGTRGAVVKIETPLTGKIEHASGYDSVNGWGSGEAPVVYANSSAQHVRIPADLKPHSVAMYPSPTLCVAAGWMSPISATLVIEGRLQHAQPECGNGVTWSLELRRGAVRQPLAAGVAQGTREVTIGPLKEIAVQRGDLVSLIIGPRDGDHACDLTAVELTLAGGGREWNLAREVSPDVLAGNPHADSYGNPKVWHFYAEPDTGGLGERVIPVGSLLARWQSAATVAEKHQLAQEIEGLLKSGPGTAKESPDGLLYRHLSSLRGPLVVRGLYLDKALPGLSRQRSSARGPAVRAVRSGRVAARPASAPADPGQPAFGLAPNLFGKHPNGSAIDPASLCVQAPHVLDVRLPADLVEGCEFVTGGALDEKTGQEGSVQLQVKYGPAEPPRAVSPDRPVVAPLGSPARERFAAAFTMIRELFPPSLCYTKIVPADEGCLTLYHREDDHLRRLMLDQAQTAELDRLWAELHFVSMDALTLVDAFEQFLENAIQYADKSVYLPMREPINQRAAAFRRELVAAEPRHLDAIVALADRAFRRPLSTTEASGLRDLYRRLRAEQIPHDEAIRLVLARVLAAPTFLYRIEKPPSGPKAAPVSDWELASRLSYFLWSSLPDDELRSEAAAGRLHHPEVVVSQARRMAKDPRVRRLATEFACQWLHIYDFDSLDEKSPRHFPTFAALRGAMHEEAILFFTDMFQNDGSVLSALEGDHTFLNEALAKHYGIPGVIGPEWRRVDGVRKYGRGGILGLAATLAKQSGASRTSPILRGNWVAEVLLGEKLPRPPKTVPRLPDDETATQELTTRQLVERHTADPQCASCHSRIDAFGYALEAYDAIGRRRDRDLGNRPIDTAARLRDGTEFDGLDGLRHYLANTRRDAFLRQFCRKFLGYALGRATQLSDLPLLEEMELVLKNNDYRFSAMLEAVVGSRQFREIRGRDAETRESRE